MKRLAIVAALLMSSPALAQTAVPPPSLEDVIAAQNQQIGQLYYQIGTLQQQLNHANSMIQQPQKAAPQPASAVPATAPDK